MGRHRIEIEFSDYGNPDAAEQFLARIDAAISTFDWHVTQLEIGMTPVVRPDDQCLDDFFYGTNPDNKTIYHGPDNYEHCPRCSRLRDELNTTP